MSENRALVPSLSRRLVCMAYDAFLVVAVLFVAFLLPQAAIAAALGHALPVRLMWAQIFAVTAFYFLWFWRHGGQTLAMKTWKIRLAGHDQRTPSVPQMLLRYALMWPSIFGFGAGIVWAIFDRDHQFLHDRLAGTRLVSV
jgi:uncharacterized RDD family membrane protein YckC